MIFGWHMVADYWPGNHILKKVYTYEYKEGQVFSVILFGDELHLQLETFYRKGILRTLFSFIQLLGLQCFSKEMFQ